MKEQLKIVKQERRELFLALCDLHTSHIPLDTSHKIGTDKDCAECDRYNEINSSLEVSDATLKIFDNKTKLTKYNRKRTTSSAAYSPTATDPQKKKIYESVIDMLKQEKYTLTEISKVNKISFDTVKRIEGDYKESL